MAKESGTNRERRAELERAALAVHSRFGSIQRLIIRALELLLAPFAWGLRVSPLPDLNQVQKIVVLEQGHLGDVILLTPFLQALRARYPRAHLALLGRPGLKDLLEVQGLVDEHLAIQFPWTAGLPRWKVYNPFSLRVPRFGWNLLQLRRRQFDLGFVAGWGDIRHNLALFLTGPRRRIAYGFAGGGMLLTDVVPPDLSRLHHSDLSLRLLEHLDIPGPPRQKILSLTREDQEFGRAFFSHHRIDADEIIVGIHPRAGASLKEWGDQRFQQVAEQIVRQFRARVIWFEDPARPPANSKGESRGIVRAALPLRQFLAVLACCDALVCNDSGPMHMAAALGVRVVAIFGPEFPDWYAPLDTGHQVVIRKAMWCRPCWRQCRFTEPYCLRLISPDDVMQSLWKILEDRARPVGA